MAASVLQAGPMVQMILARRSDGAPASLVSFLISLEYQPLAPALLKRSICPQIRGDRAKILTNFPPATYVSLFRREVQV